MRQWFRFQNAADDPSVVDIYIYGDIGQSFWNDDAVSAKQFIDTLRDLPASAKSIRVHVNSLGGDVFDGVAIANALRDQRTAKGRTVETIVDGIAASIASVIVQAGSPITMADNALMFLHEPWSFTVGNAKDMRKTADDLDAIRASIVATYKWNTALTDDEIVALLEAETWLDPDAAIEYGLATAKVEGLKAAASLDRKALAKLKVPERFKARVDSLLQPEPPKPSAAAAADVLRLCREGECLDVAESLVSAGATLEQVNARIATEKQTRADAAARASQIRTLCANAKFPELADDYVAGGMPVDRVMAQLTVWRAKRDTAVIDGSLPPDGGTVRNISGLNPTAIYAERNGQTTKKENRLS